MVSDECNYGFWEDDTGVDLLVSTKYKPWSIYSLVEVSGSAKVWGTTFERIPGKGCVFPVSTKKEFQQPPLAVPLLQ